MVPTTRGRLHVSQSDFDAAIEGFREALHKYVKGDPRAVIACLSRREDVTLANPLGPPRVGPTEVDKATAHGASLLTEGSVRGFEEISRYKTPALGYVLQIERTQARLPGSDDMVTFALRVTMIFRPEEGGWKIVHRHADPITTDRPISTVIEK
jgi:ketosteroid isomerase-like protein